MADIESNINLNIDTSDALASLRSLQRQISTFQQTMSKTGAVSSAQLSNMQQNLVNSVNSTGQFTASIQRVATTTESFTTALERNKLSMGQYFRFAGSQVTGFRKIFSTEFDTIDKVARERVKTLQTQYIKLGRDASGAMQAIAVRPQVLDMKDLGTQTAMAAQKAQLFNQLMKQGSTDLLNFGKNTQWAGRQLMVGFTIPLGIMGAAAAKEFKAIEEQVIRLERVYGDFTTTMADTEAITENIKTLAGEFTKYGVAVSKTIGLAADAAAMGKTGADLVAQVAEANRLAVLGGVDQAQSLETTISLTNAFGVASDKLAGKINFLNAVENQTVTSIEDMTDAIPKAGPVVQQLGGNVEDLTFFLTAMKEGGINASEGANALKSGLASLINPSSEANEMLAGFGVNLQGIVDANKGNVKGIVVDFAKALDTLDPLNRAQAIEQLFGKFQFSRLSTLFQNVIAEGSQAQRVLQLTSASSTELAALSERELSRIEESPLYKFEGAVERFKASMAPIGETFMKAVTPIIDFGTKLLESFNGWSDQAKSFTVILTGVVAGLGPILLMTFGLIANGVANVVKGFMFVRGMLDGTGRSSNVLAEQTNYMTTQQLEAAAVASSLGQVHSTLIQTFNAEAGSVRNLAAAYGSAIAAQGSFMGPITTRGGGMKRVGKMATGGIVRGPGSGTSDSIPTMLSNGEAVIPAKQVKKNPQLVSGLISGQVKHMADGGYIGKVYPEFALRMQNAQENMSQQAGRTNLASVLAPLSLRAGEARGITPTQSSINAGKFDNIAKELENVTSRFVDEVNNNFDTTFADIKDSNERFAKSWTAAGKTVEKEVNKIGDAATKGAVRKTFGLDEDVYGTAATEVRRAGDARLTRGRKSILKGEARSYTAIRPGAKKMYQRLSGDTTSDMQMGHVFGSREQDLVQLANSPKATPALKRAMKALGFNIVEEAATAINQASLAASPAKRFIDAAGRNIVDGALLPIEKAGRRATMAGTAIATATTQATADATSRGRGPKRVSTDMLAYDAVSGQHLPKSDLEARKAERKAEAIRRAKAIATNERRANLKAGITTAMSPGRMAGAGMMASMAAGGLSMVGGPIGEIAGAASGPLMALTGIASVLSMIPGPAGLVVAGLGAVAAGLIYIDQEGKKIKESANATAQALSSGADKMKEFAVATGTVTAAEQMAKKELEIKARREIDTSEDSFGKSFLSSETGKKYQDDLQVAIQTVGKSEAVSNLGIQISSAIASGLLTTDQAQSVVDNLAIGLGDADLAAELTAQVVEFIGPNGENLKDTPIPVMVKLIEEKGKNVKDVIGNLEEGSAPLFWEQDRLRARAATEAAVATAMRDIVDQEQEAAAAAELRHTQKIDELRAAGDIAAVNEENLRYEKERASIQKASAEQLLSARTKLNAMDTYNKTTGKYGYDSTNVAMIDQLEANTKSQFADQPQAVKDVSNATVEAMANTSYLGTGTKATLLATVDVQNIESFNKLYEFFKPGEKDSAKVYNYIADISTTLGADESGDVAKYLAMFEGDETKTAKFQAQFDVSNPEAIEKTQDMLNTLDIIEQYGGVAAVNVAIQLDESKLQEVKDGVAAVDAMFASGENVPVTKVYDLVLNSTGIEMTQSAMDYYNSLSPSDQKTYTTAYLTVTESIDAGTEAGKARLREWAAGQGQKGKTSKYYDKGNKIKGALYDYSAIAADMAASEAARAVQNPVVIGGSPSTQPPPTNNNTSGGGGGSAAAEPEKPPTSFLDSIVKDLRDFTNTAQGLTENFQDSMNAIRSSVNNIYGGLSQQMRGLGAGEDVISLMTGMSKEEWDQYKGQFFNFDSAGNITGFKDDLNKISEKLRTLTLAKFVDEQQKSIAASRDQSAALTKLVSLGMSYADAYKMVEDAALAAAIANATSADQIREIIKLSQQAAEARTIAEASGNVANMNAATDATNSAMAAVIKYNDALSDAQVSAIMASDDLQTMMANFSSLTPDQLNVLNEALRDADLQAEIELKVKMQTKEGMQEIFNDGFSKAMEQFSAKEQSIKIKFEALRNPFEDIISSFSNQIEDLKNTPGGLDDLEADLQRIGEQEIDINKKYDDRFKALDRIQQANEKIAQQQRSQLSLAEALSMGDIAAAARAADEMRSQQAAQALVDQREALQKSQQLELDQLTGQMGLTRSQLEERIRDLKIQIFEIEESQIEPAQRQIELLARQEELEINSLTVLGKTREEWEKIKAEIELARTTNDAYNESIGLALDVANELIKKWKEIEKPKETIHTIIENRVDQANAEAARLAAEEAARKKAAAEEAARQAALASQQAAPSGPVKDDAWLNEMARRAYRGEFGNGQARRNALGADYQAIQDRVNRNYYAKGGIVANYLARGGFPGMPKMGTDTVPAMLTPGEFVVKKYAVDSFGADNLKAINNGTYKGGSVYNNTYSINVNARTNANPDEIARTVIAQIKQVDSQRIRGNRF